MCNKMFQKLLIANRGEIVNRIINACYDLGVETVAIYSDADKDASFLKQADEIYYVGPSNPIKSYLNIESIIDVMKKSGADAVHPGYGFLSESYAFADAVKSNGVTWVGPPPPVLKAIESKCFCREKATSINVPIIPGSIKPVQNINEICQYVSKHGYPITLKLDKGGGGKGIKVIENEQNIQDNYEELSRVGLMAFNSSDCYIEKKVASPRHIEVQFLIDKKGNCVCLGERECSIQRRYQKIIEESPSPIVSEEDRNKLYEYTINLAQAMGYINAGTMEFLRSNDGKYYFMEVNARLQVEHPVTEFVAGVDLVKNQLAIAAGKTIKFEQKNVKIQGHSIEARVYAENPVTFIPSPGTIKKLHLPKIFDRSHLRIDHAIEEGEVVPPYYDPLLVKVVSWDYNRNYAINRLKKALSQFYIEGIQTTIPLNLQILNNDKYIQGNFDTTLIDELNISSNSS